MNQILIDTSVLVRNLRGGGHSLFGEESPILGRKPLVSPVTLHELRRGLKPGSAWEKEALVPSSLLLVDPPNSDDWLLAADILRKLFLGKSKDERAVLQNDVFIAIAAKRAHAILWAADGDFPKICSELGVVLA